MSKARESMDQKAEPLGEIELGLTVEQACAIVREYDALWQAASWYGKKQMKELRRLRDTLEREGESR